MGYLGVGILTIALLFAWAGHAYLGYLTLKAIKNENKEDEK